MSKKQTAINIEPKVSFADDKKYTVAEIAEMLGKSTKTVYQWIKTRKLRAYRFGKEFIITASQLNDFAESRFLKKWFPDWSNLEELDPAFVPPIEVNIDSLTEAQILSAYVIMSELVLTNDNIETSQKNDEHYDDSAC